MNYRSFLLVQSLFCVIISASVIVHSLIDRYLPARLALAAEDNDLSNFIPAKPRVLLESTPTLPDFDILPQYLDTFADSRIGYTIEPEAKCFSSSTNNTGSSHGQQGAKLLILATSAIEEKEKRNALRVSSIGQPISDVRVYFVVGLAKHDRNQEELEQESKTFQDIIQITVEDVYRNLARKVFAMILWAAKNCEQNVFVMKTDSDIVIFQDNLHRFLQQHIKSTKTMFGACRKNGGGPIRDRFSKWYVSKKTYGLEHYPPFCSGSGYLMTPDVPQRLVDVVVSRRTKYFPLEDVMFSGIAPEAAGVQRVNVPGFNVQLNADCKTAISIHLATTAPSAITQALSRLKARCG